MNKTLRSASYLIATLVVSASAEASLFRAYVASTGNDSNACTLVAPCRLLPAALNAVSPGGEIWMLDSANYNTATVSISQSVSILAIPGTVGSVLAIGGPAISITAPGLTVSLRNVVIAPLSGGGGTDGIDMTGASALTVENSLLTNLPGIGIFVAGAGATLKVTDTTLRNMSSDWAILLNDGADADIYRTNMLNNFGGIEAAGSTATTTTASVSDSIIAGAAGGAAGAEASALASGATAKVFLTRCTIKGLAEGLHTFQSGGGTSLIVAGNNMITNNTFGWLIGNSTVIESMGNNQFSDNGSNTGTLTPLALQ